MRTMTRTATHVDTTDRFSYLLVGGGLVSMAVAVLAAIAV